MFHSRGRLWRPPGQAGHLVNPPSGYQLSRSPPVFPPLPPSAQGEGWRPGWGKETAAPCWAQHWKKRDTFTQYKQWHAAATEERCCWYRAERFNRDRDGLSPAWIAANPVTLHLYTGSERRALSGWITKATAAQNTHSTNSVQERIFIRPSPRNYTTLRAYWCSVFLRVTLLPRAGWEHCQQNGELSN